MIGRENRRSKLPPTRRGEAINVIAAPRAVKMTRPCGRSPIAAISEGHVQKTPIAGPSSVSARRPLYSVSAAQAAGVWDQSAVAGKNPQAVQMAAEWRTAGPGGF